MTAPMTESFAILLLSGFAIYFASEFFVNGVEWLGRKLGVGETATGTLLASLGTALPESIVTFVALALGDDPGDVDIGIGAALGGPLVLGTIAYAVVGASMLRAKQTRRPNARLERADNAWLTRAQIWFLVIFALKIGLGVVAFRHKAAMGILFLIVYAWFCVSEFSAAERSHHHDLDPLKIRPKAEEPSLAWVLVQTLGSLVVVFVASRLFVDHLGDVAIGFGLKTGVVAIFLSPIATELPEIMNAMIWVRQGKRRLALANISGAMMIQATVPTAFGLLFSPWLLDRVALFSAAATAAAMVALLILFRTGRASGWALIQTAWFYLAFIAAVIWAG
jgi:cation:H+ antiporter